MKKLVTPIVSAVIGAILWATLAPKAQAPKPAQAVKQPRRSSSAQPTTPTSGKDDLPPTPPVQNTPFTPSVKTTWDWRKVRWDMTELEKVFAFVGEPQYDEAENEMVWLVESKKSVYSWPYYARFYSAEGVETTDEAQFWFDPVRAEWEQGARFHLRLQLPDKGTLAQTTMIVARPL